MSSLTARTLSRVDKIALVSSIIIAGFVFSLCYHYMLAFYQGLSYPFSTFLFRPEDCFNDFYNIQKIMWQTDAKSFGAYPPVAYLVFAPFGWMSPHVSFLVFTIGWLGTLLFITWHELRESSIFATLRNVLVFSVLTYPVLYALDRSNFEVYIFLFLYFAVKFNSRNLALPSTLLFAVSAASKIFPGVFLFLPLSQRRWRESIGLIVATALLTLLGLAAFNQGFLKNIEIYLHVSRWYQSVYVIRDEGLYFGHSLFGAVKVFVYLIGNGLYGSAYLKTVNAPELFTTVSRYYAVAVLLLFAVFVAYILFIEKALWKKAMLLVVAMNVFPYVSSDYKLLHVLIPLYFFINSEEEDRLSGLYATLFGLLLIPKDYGHPYWDPEASSSVVLTPLLFLAMAATIIVSGVRTHGRRGDGREKPLLHERLDPTPS